MDREDVVWNCSYVNALKRAVLHRTVPIHRVNGNAIRTYAERFHIEPFQNSHVSAALRNRSPEKHRKTLFLRLKSDTPR